MKKYLAYLLFLFIPLALQAANAPKDSLQKLMDGNDRYVLNKSIHPNRSLERRESISSKQEPFAVIIGCSDSRVAPEIIFDQGMGDLFVIRVAGNVIGPIELASIEYAVEVLHAPLIFVLGHENCGAVKAVLNHEAEDMESIAKRIEKALQENKVKFSDNNLENAVKANVNWVVKELHKNELIHKFVEAKKLALASGYYRLNSGKVELCCLEGIAK